MVNMVDVLARNAWMLVARGIFAVIFGLVARLWPGITLAALVLLFGVYALMDGIFAIAAAITGAVTAVETVATSAFNPFTPG